ncbi:reverse transcriptase domain-containing protein [Tanacetum coccineum]
MCPQFLSQRLRNNYKRDNMLNANCSTILLNKIPKKMGDSGPFTFPCGLENNTVKQALVDLVGDDDFKRKEEVLAIDSPLITKVKKLPQDDTFNLKPSIEDPPSIELKYLPSHLEYAFLAEDSKLLVIIGKDHFPLPFIDEIIERLEGNEFYSFLDGFFSYFQIRIAPEDQEKSTFTCPYGTFAYRRMPFGFCNASATFQRYTMAIFHDMIESSMEVFMDDFSVFGNTFDSCLNNLKNMLSRCEATNLVLKLEKCHFMV